MNIFLCLNVFIIVTGGKRHRQGPAWRPEGSWGYTGCSWTEEDEEEEERAQQVDALQEA